MKHKLVIFPPFKDAIIEKLLNITNILPVNTEVVINVTTYMARQPKSNKFLKVIIDRIDFIEDIDTIFYMSHIDPESHDFTEKVMKEIYKKNKLSGFKTTWNNY